MTQIRWRVRDAEAGELDALAALWHDAWHDGHAVIVPKDLVALRTLDDFRARLPAMLDALRTIGPVGAPLGLCVIREDEMQQLFVAAEARGTGVAAQLLADAERRLAQAGVSEAWLDAAIGNDRAIRFYERAGWAKSRIADEPLDTAEGKGRYILRVQIMVKRVADAAPKHDPAAR
ncbi:GNAT family N-acetyltransferase [Gymnodinialimonas sp. 2305UL16-5]|uniref:GNAT family N-acetyltransferase n=1 Tax=Gymnodinialimonas mytili TaxID=3126503 RepID=UPI0030A1E73E